MKKIINVLASIFVFMLLSVVSYVIFCRITWYEVCFDINESWTYLAVAMSIFLTALICLILVAFIDWVMDKSKNYRDVISALISADDDLLLVSSNYQSMVMRNIMTQTDKQTQKFDLLNEAASYRGYATLSRESAEEFRKRERGILKIFSYLLWNGYYKAAYRMEKAAAKHERFACKLEKIANL